MLEILGDDFKNESTTTLGEKLFKAHVKAASASHPCELHDREMVRRGDGP